jgi:hypothetical protein
MHTNHRRKSHYKYQGRRWHTALSSFKASYWEHQRALERDLMSNGRFDEIQNRHPKCVLWDAL